MLTRAWLLVSACGSLLSCGATTGAAERPPLAIMPLGDSITAGYHVGKGGYRNILRDALIHRGMRVDFIGRSTDKSDGIPDPEHEGYSGHTIGQIAAKADVALQELNPDIILLFAGTNDIRVNGDNDNPNDPLYWRTAPARFEELLAVVWQRRPDAVVLVGTLMPLAETFASREPAAQEFNANLVKIVAAAQARGKRIRLVDFRRSVSAEDLSDGAHPNAAGYEKMAALWAEAIAEVAPGGAEKAPAEPPGPR